MSYQMILISNCINVLFMFDSMHNLKGRKNGIKTEKLIKRKSDVSDTAMPAPQNLEAMSLD